jgi:hypothetical protein
MGTGKPRLWRPPRDQYQTGISRRGEVRCAAARAHLRGAFWARTGGDELVLSANHSRGRLEQTARSMPSCIGSRGSWAPAVRTSITAASSPKRKRSRRRAGQPIWWSFLSVMVDEERVTTCPRLATGLDGATGTAPGFNTLAEKRPGRPFPTGSGACGRSGRGTRGGEGGGSSCRVSRSRGTRVLVSEAEWSALARAPCPRSLAPTDLSDTPPRRCVRILPLPDPLDQLPLRGPPATPRRAPAARGRTR